MAQQDIFTGTTANDGTGDQLKDAFDKTQANFDELYADDVVTAAHIADGTIHVSTTVPALPHGIAGDLAGTIASDSTYIYVCILDYVDDATVSWKRIALEPGNDATNWV